MDTKWYVAELVMRLTVVDDPRNAVDRNLTLLRANSREEAYEKALKYGKRGEAKFVNPEGKEVRIEFRGISDLVEATEPPEDGAELMFYRQLNVTEERIRSLVRKREHLSAFRPPKRGSGPNFASAQILTKLEEAFGDKLRYVTVSTGSPRRQRRKAR